MHASKLIFKNEKTDEVSEIERINVMLLQLYRQEISDDERYLVIVQRIKPELISSPSGLFHEETHCRHNLANHKRLELVNINVRHIICMQNINCSIADNLLIIPSRHVDCE